MSETPLVERLRQRKLVQWTLAYLAGAWVILQVLDGLVGAFGWPASVLRIGWLVLGIGFFGALVLAWYHGEKGQQHVSGAELLLLSAVLAVAGGVVWLAGGSEAEVASGTKAQAVPTAGGAVLASSVPLERSLAVLPFDNLSESKENEYFSDGITDEILTTLANVGDLRVISRTSVMQYKGSSKPLRQIASELGVAHVLEGSVQRAGNQVRINAQLIDAKTDAHLWAQRYDRPLQDIFAVQSEIAQQIAQALQAELSPAEQQRVERAPTTNMLAYDYVLQGQDLVRRSSPRDIEAAIPLLRRALQLDPTYPDALAALASAFRLQYRFTGDRTWLDSAVVAARRSIDLDKDFAPGFAALGWALDWRGDPQAALKAHLHAVQLNPNLSDGLANVYHWGFGRLDEAARWWDPALRSDPTNSMTQWLAGRTYLHLGMPTRARSFLEKTIQLLPDFAFPYYHLSEAFLQENRPQDAKRVIQRMLSATQDAPEALILAGYHAISMGDLGLARRYFERGLAGGPLYEEANGRAVLAWVLRQAGEIERSQRLTQDAVRLFQKQLGRQPARPEDYIVLARLSLLQGNRESALRQIDEGVRKGWRFIYESPDDPILNSLRGEPRYDRLMVQVKADIDRQRARVEREGW